MQFCARLGPKPTAHQRIASRPCRYPHRLNAEGVIAPSCTSSRPLEQVAHGCSDLLDRMAAAISADLAANPVEECLTVTLGDYIDRGPDLRGVIERLTKNPFPTKFIALKGNHELMFETFLRNASIGSQWRKFGGLETLVSYGVPVGSVMLGNDYKQAAEALKAAVPQAHLEFISRLRTSLSVGQYFLCHAGIRPGVPLERQSAEDLLWIRAFFLDSRADFGKTVVHGHTPAEKPEAAREPNQRRYRRLHDQPAHLRGSGERAHQVPIGDQLAPRE